MEGRNVLIGNRKLMIESDVKLADLDQKVDGLAQKGKTPMFVAIDEKIAGIIAVADVVKESSGKAIKTWVLKL